MESNCGHCGGVNGQGQFSVTSVDKLMLMEMEANNLKRQVQILTATVVVLQECVEKTFGFPVINTNSVYYKVLDGPNVEMDNMKSSLELEIPSGKVEAETHAHFDYTKRTNITSGNANLARQLSFQLGGNANTVKVEVTQQPGTETCEAIGTGTLDNIQSESTAQDGEGHGPTATAENVGGCVPTEAHSEVKPEFPEVQVTATTSSPALSKIPKTSSSHSHSVVSSDASESKRTKFMTSHCSQSTASYDSQNSTSAQAKIAQSSSARKPHKCSYCQMSFYTSSEKKIHERTHTGEKPHKCIFCPASFADSTNRKRHERTHTGEKPYTCKFCGMSFSQMGNRTKHERIHTGQKPYNCQFCNAAFNTSSARNKHERTHTGGIDLN